MMRKNNTYLQAVATFMMSIDLLDKYSLTKEGETLSLTAEIAEHKKTFQGSMPEMPALLQEVGMWMTSLPKSIWIDKK